MGEGWTCKPRYSADQGKWTVYTPTPDCSQENFLAVPRQNSIRAKCALLLTVKTTASSDILWGVPRQITSGDKMSLAPELGDRSGWGFRLSPDHLLIAKRDEDTRVRVVRSRRAHLSRRSSSNLFRIDRGGGSGSRILAMMQTAELWCVYNFTACKGIFLSFTLGGCSLRQRKMSTVLVVVTDVIVHKAFEMALVQNNHMVQQVSPATADPALGNTILPRLRKLVRLGWMPKSSIEATTSSLKLAARSNIR